MSKVRIGVLMGGRSEEREVSLNSGRTLCDHLDTSCYTVIPIFQSRTGKLYHMPPHFLHRGKISDFEHRLDSEANLMTWDELKDAVDCVYIAQHGRFAEDGSLQGLLEILKIPYCGSKVLASAVGMDKGVQYFFLKTAGIEVPRSIIVQPRDIKKLVEVHTFFPCIVKPVCEGSSLGVTVVAEAQELLEAVVKASTVTPGLQQAVIIQEYVQGMEFSCIVLTDYKNQTLLPLPPTEIVLNRDTLYFDYEQKYMPGKAVKYTPARCSQEQRTRIQEACVAVMKVLDIKNIARIDGILTRDNRVVIIDPNTFSGMDPASFAFVQAAELDMSPTHLINHLIETELHAYTMNVGELDRSMPEKIPGNKKLRIGVFMGGQSNEREISLASGRNVTYKLSPHTYEVIPIFVSSSLELYSIDQRLLVRNSTAEIEAELKPEMKIAWSGLSSMVDFVFNGLHGGHGENGSVQGALEMLGIPYNGSSVLSSALCMDKFKTTQLLSCRGIAVPRNMLIDENMWRKGVWQDSMLEKYPCIVKPHDDGCSVLVHKVYNEQELRTAVELIFSSGKKAALVEEYIAGIELTVGVIGNDRARALPPSMSVAQAGVLSMQEKFLPGAGENQTPAPLAPEILKLVQSTVEKAYEIVECKGYARIDCFYQPARLSPTGEDRVVVLEINTLPALTPATCIFHQAAEIGLRPMDFIDLLVKLGLHKHAPHLLDSNPDMLVQTITNISPVMEVQG